MSKWAWCLVDDNEKLVTGWCQIGDYWYYMYSSGAMACDEWVKLDDAWFKVNDKGQMLTGWYQDADGNWYYLSETSNPDKAIYLGQMLTGWQKVNDKLYYLEPNSNGYRGAMYKDGTFTIEDKEYTFNADGSLVERKYFLSDKGADFIGSWEGFWRKADYDPFYPGVEKYITIGYGTTMEAMPDAFPKGIDSTCTIEQAREWLEEEAQECAQTIKSDLDSKGVSISQNELDALISFAYNCGTGALFGSALYKNICTGVKDEDSITANFQSWSNANGARVPGLYKRRTSEASLFLNGDYLGNN